MNYTTGRHQALWLLLIWICFSGTCARPGVTNLQAHYLRAIRAYRRLEQSLPPEELRALTGIGVLNGARQAEQKMEEHLVEAIKELLLQTDFQQNEQILPKIEGIEKQLARDRGALNILSSTMDMLSSDTNEHKFQKELRDLLRQQQKLRSEQQQLTQPSAEEEQLGERLGQLRRQILQQVPEMKSQLDLKIERALEHLVKHATADGPLAKARRKVLHKRAVKEEQLAQKGRKEPEETNMINDLLTEANQLNEQDDDRNNMVIEDFERSAKNNDGQKQKPKAEVEVEELSWEIDSQNVTANNKTKVNAKQENDVGSSAELPNDANADGGNGAGAGGGGLVGIIGSLSGGEGGSDVGALIGALTGVISTLFGPGGLDIESLISTSTSLLSGLLAGNKNFGTVLGQYVGTAFDGLSGGGGAINNGVFLGNLLGTVLASLSADPEDEGPPQPLTFTKNFLSSFIQANFRQNSGDGSEERHGSAEVVPRQKKKMAAGTSFDSGGFVKQIASHLVSSALGLLLNASLGASGGASHASTGLLHTSSSHHSKPASSRSWE